MTEFSRLDVRSSRSHYLHSAVVKKFIGGSMPQEKIWAARSCGRAVKGLLLDLVAGRNPKSLSGEEIGSEIWVDAGSEALSAQGAFALVGFEDVEGGVSNDGEIERGMVFSGSAVVFIENHVQRPVEIVSMPQCARVAARMAFGSGASEEM